MTGRANPAACDRAVRVIPVLVVLALLPGCSAGWMPPARPERAVGATQSAGSWRLSCPIDAATVASIVGAPMRQITPDDETPWCEFVSDDNDAQLAVLLDDRASIWGDTLPEARREHERITTLTCTQADASALGPDAFTSSCEPSADDIFFTGSALFTMNGAIKEVTINKNHRRGQPADLAGPAEQIAQHVLSGLPG